MPNPVDPGRPQATAEDSFLDLLVETLETLERGARGQFLQRFFKALAQVEMTETHSLECWDQVLERRRELSESLNKPISLKTALVDVLAGTSFMRLPILVEYDELKKLQINAATDALTGLYNRRLFEEYFIKELNRSKRYGQQLALVLMDLHRFKEVNDRFGHMTGDQALQIAATALRKTVRTSDYAFRIGGDEFALLLPQCDPEQCNVLARRLRTNYDTGVMPLKLDVPLALDYGLAVYPEDGDQKETLTQIADQRLYQFKHSMRNQPRIVGKEAPPPAREIPPAPPAREIPPVPPREIPSAPPGFTAPPARPFTEAAMPPIAPAVPLTPAKMPVAAEPLGSDKRKWERVSLAGTRAYAILGDDARRTARVLDLSYGGVALETERPDDLPQSFQAVLHVPILPPVKVSLRKTYEQRVTGNGARIGCAFVS